MTAHMHPAIEPPLARGLGDPQRSFAVALGITLGLLAIEAVGGWVTGSLALLADAGHLLADLGALGIGLVGSWIASRPATAKMSYGYRRAEILAAATNACALWAVAAAILYEAVQRLRLLHPVSAPGMLAVALVGLVGNLASSVVLARGREGNLNLRVALVHTLADAAAAVGTIAASLVILVTRWVQADAVASIGIGALILAGSWPPLREAVQILMEGAPARLSLAEVEAAMREVAGVTGVHDLHIWSLTAGVEAVSGHVLLGDASVSQRVLGDLCRLLADRYGLSHATLQLETEASTDPGHPNCIPVPRSTPSR